MEFRSKPLGTSAAMFHRSCGRKQLLARINCILVFLWSAVMSAVGYLCTVWATVGVMTWDTCVDMQVV